MKKSFITSGPGPHTLPTLFMWVLYKYFQFLNFCQYVLKGRDYISKGPLSGNDVDPHL